VPRRRKVLTHFHLLARAKRAREAFKRGSVKVAGSTLPFLGWLLRFRSPTSGLRTFHGSRATFLCGEEDSRLFLTWGRWEFERLQRSGRVSFRHLNELPHIPLHTNHRDTIADALNDYVESMLMPLKNVQTGWKK
jgi:hypothetical protein